MDIKQEFWGKAPDGKNIPNKIWIENPNRKRFIDEPDGYDERYYAKHQSDFKFTRHHLAIPRRALSRHNGQYHLPRYSVRCLSGRFTPLRRRNCNAALPAVPWHTSHWSGLVLRDLPSGIVGHARVERITSDAGLYVEPSFITPPSLLGCSSRDRCPSHVSRGRLPFPIRLLRFHSS